MFNNLYSMIYLQDYKGDGPITSMVSNDFYHMWETSTILAPNYDMAYNKYSSSVITSDTPKTITLKMISTNIDRGNVFTYIKKIKSICLNPLNGKPEKVKMYIIPHMLNKDENWYCEVFLSGDIKVDYDINKVVVTFTFLQYDTSEYFDYFGPYVNNMVLDFRKKLAFYKNNNLSSYYTTPTNAKDNYSVGILGEEKNIVSPLLIMRCISDATIFRFLTIHLVRNNEFVKTYSVGDWYKQMKVPDISSFSSVHDSVPSRVIGVGIDFETGIISLYNLKELDNMYKKYNKILEDKNTLGITPLSLKDLKPQDWEFGNNGMWITPDLKWDLNMSDAITFQHKGSKSNVASGFEAYLIYRTRRF